MKVAQSIQSYSQTQQTLQPQTCMQEHCPGETGPLSVFQAVHEMSFQSPEFHIQCEFICKKAMQLVSGIYRKG